MLAEELTENGYLTISCNDLKKKIATIYLKKNEVNLETDILDTPDYFWDNDKYQQNFHSVFLINHILDIEILWNSKKNWDTES